MYLNISFYYLKQENCIFLFKNCSNAKYKCPPLLLKLADDVTNYSYAFPQKLRSEYPRLSPNQFFVG